MFCYFALFFQMVPHLRGDWISMGTSAMYLVAAAFSMIPVLANFSCRLKGNGGLKAAEDPVGAKRHFQLPFRLPAALPWNSKRTHTDGSVFDEVKFVRGYRTLRGAAPVSRCTAGITSSEIGVQRILVPRRLQ